MQLLDDFSFFRVPQIFLLLRSILIAYMDILSSLGYLEDFSDLPDATRLLGEYPALC